MNDLPLLNWIINDPTSTLEEARRLASLHASQILDHETPRVSLATITPWDAQKSQRPANT